MYDALVIKKKYAHDNKFLGSTTNSKLFTVYFQEHEFFLEL